MHRHAKLNRIYRLIWDRSRQTWVVASELSSGRARGGRSPRRLLAAVLGAAAMPALALPTGAQLGSGSGQISQNGSQLTVDQSSQNLTINWQGFSIGSGETVLFNQPNSSAIALNRVLGQDPSQILGSLKANGRVFILNPNGVLFGRSAQVNVGGLVASTLNLSDSDLAAGRFHFSGSSSAAVVNEGSLQASPGGYIALLGARLGNQGSIQAQQGRIALATGQEVTLQLDNGSLLGLTVDRGAVQALIDNGGVLQADGGDVLLTTRAADALGGAVINTTGLIEAQTLDGVRGTIHVLGDAAKDVVNVGGTLDASAPNGGSAGFIETSAARVRVADGARISTRSASGTSGQWLIDPTDFTIAASNGDISGATLSTNLATANVTIQSSAGKTSGNGDINVNDAISWSSNNVLTLTAGRDINFNANVTATGADALLALEYGQAAVNANNTAGYTLASGVKINLQAGENFTTKLGSDGDTVVWTVITRLGSAGSTSPTSLQGINGDLNGNYVLGADIDASATKSWNSGAGFVPIGSDAGTSFDGVFDGLGHSISGLVIARPDTDNVGLFGYSTGILRNVSLSTAAIGGGNNVGALVGYNDGGSLSNVSAGGAVAASGDVAGGLVGFNSNAGDISSASSTVAVVGAGSKVGGLVGQNDGALASVSATGLIIGADTVGGLVGYNTGDLVSGSASGAVSSDDGNVGGLVGVSEGSIDKSSATGAVKGAGSSGNVGGLVGSNSGSITASNAVGVVSGAGPAVGGLAGYSEGSIGNSYARGAVSGDGDRVGGLVGDNAGSISGSYALGAVSGKGSYTGGLAGYNENFGNIATSFAAGDVSGSGDAVGGLVGQNDGVITNAYAVGAVTGTATAVGGLVGYNTGRLDSVYSTGRVSGASADSTGGLVGVDDGGSYTAAYWDVLTSGIDSDAAATGLDTSDLQAALPTGFDASVWGIVAAKSYPYLLTQFSGGAPQVISGTVVNADGTPVDGGTAVRARLDGSTLTSVFGNVNTGANGYYYYLLQGGTLNGGNLLVNTGNAAGFVDGANGSYSGSNGIKLQVGTLNVVTGAGGLSALLSNINKASGSTLTAGTLLSSLTSTSLSNLTLSRSGAFDINDAGSTLSVPGTLRLNVTGNVTQSGAVNVGTLTGSSSGSTALGRADNQIGQLSAYSSNGLTLQTSGALSVQGRVSAGSGDVLLRSGGSLGLSSGSVLSGARIVLVDGSSFTNQAGAGALSATQGWQIWSQNPTLDTLGGLAGSYKQYNASYGSSTVLGSGNGLLYTLAPKLGVSLVGATSKVYDGGTGASLLSSNYAVSGLLGTDTVTLAGIGNGVYATKNAGSALTVTASGLSVASASDGAIPVYGYQLAASTATGAIGTITPAQLILAAVSDSKTYDGGLSSSKSVSISGLQGSDTVSATQSFQSKDVLGSNASTLFVNAGYTINDGNGGKNYTVSTQTAQGTITPALLTLTANSLTRSFGLPNPTLTLTPVGLKGSDTLASLSGSVQLSTTAINSSPVGTYPILLSGNLASANYTIRYVDGVLTVAQNATGAYGAALASSAPRSQRLSGDPAMVPGTAANAWSATGLSLAAELPDADGLLLSVDGAGIRLPQ